jgi:hypothetical protein
VKSILKNLVNHEDEKGDIKNTPENDSDEEDSIVKKPLVTLEPAVTENKADITSLNDELSDATLPKIEPIAPAVEALTSNLESASNAVSNAALKAALKAASLIPSIAELVEPTPEATAIPPIPALEENNDAPTIINLDEKPKVSFASFNSFFSDEPENTDMVNATNENTPDLEILDSTGSALSGDDFDDLDKPSPIDEPLDDYEEL